MSGICECPTTMYDNVAYPSGYQMGPCVAQQTVYDPMATVEPMEMQGMAMPTPIVVQPPAAPSAPPAPVVAAPATTPVVDAPPTVLPQTTTVLSSETVAPAVAVPGAQFVYAGDGNDNMPSGYEWAPYPPTVYTLGAQIMPANDNSWLITLLILLVIGGLLWYNWAAIKRALGMRSSAPVAVEAATAVPTGPLPSAPPMEPSAGMNMHRRQRFSSNRPIRR